MKRKGHHNPPYDRPSTTGGKTCQSHYAVTAEVPVRSPSRRSPTSRPTFCPSTAWTRRKSFIRESHLCGLLKGRWRSLPWPSWRSAGCGSEVEHPFPPRPEATRPRKKFKTSSTKSQPSNTSWRRWKRGTRKTVLEALTLSNEPTAVPDRVYEALRRIRPGAGQGSRHSHRPKN